MSEGQDGALQPMEGELPADRAHPVPLCKLKKPGWQAPQSRPATLGWQGH